MNRTPILSIQQLDQLEKLRSKMTGLAVRERRLALGWSQRELADRAGISRTEVQYIESAKRSPKAGTLGRICDALNIAPGELSTQVDRMVHQHQSQNSSSPRQ